jgi:hypothetical protein
MPALRAFLDLDIDVPNWIREPTWRRPLTHFISASVLDQQAGGIFLVILFEELGMPLPAPGAGRTDIQALGPVGDRHRPADPRHADRPFRPVWNT